MNFQRHTESSGLFFAKAGLIGAMTLVGTLTLSGCDRNQSKDDETAKESKTTQTTETEVVTKAVPAVACDDPSVQDQLKLVLQATLNQRSQNYVGAYAKQADIQVAPRDVNGMIGNVLIDVQNPRVLQATNSSGMTTCQASVSMTLPSQDLYQASQVYAAAGRQDLTSKISGKNIRLNNNMLVDDNFSYVVGHQGDEVRARIAGEPAILDIVSDVMAGSLVQTAVETRRAQINAQKAQIRQDRRAEQATRREPQAPRIRQPQSAQSVQPAAPAQPAKPAAPSRSSSSPAPAATNESASNNAGANASTNAPAAASGTTKPAATTTQKLSVPTDKSIDMVIVEEEGTY